MWFRVAFWMKDDHATWQSETSDHQAISPTDCIEQEFLILPMGF